MSPYQHGICRSTTAQGTQMEALLAFLGLLVEPAFQPDALFPALDGCGRKASLGFPCKVSMNGVSLIPILELEGDSIEGIHHPWISVSMLHGVHVVCQPLAPSAISTGTVCCRGGAPPHCWWVGGRWSSWQERTG
jgi:hypothetical protein